MSLSSNKKRLKIKLLTQLNDAEQAKTARQQELINLQRIMGIVVSMLLLIASAAAYFFYRARKEKEEAYKQLAQKQQEIENKNRELAQLNKMKDKMISVISHDFKSPLNTLDGALELLKNDALSREETHMLADKLQVQITQTTRFMENMVNWARGQLMGYQPELKPVDINQPLLESLDLLKGRIEQKNIELIVDLKSSSPAICDSEMMKVVIRNLLSNAIKFTPPAGQIEISSTEQNGHLRIAVKDNGPGLRPEIQDKLFKELVVPATGSMKESGSGIGLLLTKEYVSINKGKIWAENSKNNSGAVFTVEIPRDKTKTAVSASV